MAVLKCPNPSCPFQFDPSQVPPGAIVTCPRCGMRFTLGPNEPPPPIDDLPPVPPAAEPNAATRPAEPGPERRPTQWMGIMIAVGGMALFFSIVAAVVIFSGSRQRWMNDDTESVAKGDMSVKRLNFSFQMPGDDWEKDVELQQEMGANVFAIRRTNPDAWAALSATDFGDRSPMLSELREKMSDQLHKLFVSLPERIETESAQMAGQNAIKFLFRVERKTTQEVCVGEVYAVSFKGIAYWFYTWTTQKDAAAAATQLEDCRNKFKFLDQRTGWTDKVSNEIAYRPASGKYKLSNYEKIWTVPKGLEPKDEHENADFVLKGEVKGRTARDFVPSAAIVVYVLDGGGFEAAETGSTFIRKKNTPDAAVFGPTTITEVTGEVLGDPPPGPETAGLATNRLRVTPGGPNASKSNEKYVVYASIKVGNQILVIEGICPWSQREVWEKRLIQMVSSFK